MLKEKLEDEGVKFVMGAKVTNGVATGPGKMLEIESGGAIKTISADEVLVTSNCRPNISGLGLDAAGIEVSAQGIATNARGRTSIRNVYAVGDVTGMHLDTSTADQLGRIAVMNALLKVPLRLDRSRLS
jgi:dihydrolipoamide dehydrogenase